MENSEKSQSSFFYKLGRFFLTTVLGGLVIILPLSIFVFIVQFLIKILVGLIYPLSSLLQVGDTPPSVAAHLMAIIILTLLFFIIGLTVQMPKGRAMFRLFESRYLMMLPFYSTIRETVKQFTGKRTPFSQVVMADVFGNDTRMLGFITDELTKDMFSIFVPTGPNPTNGFIFHVKRHQLEFLDVKSEEAMRSIVAVGTGTRIMLDNNDINIKAKMKAMYNKDQTPVQNTPMVTKTPPAADRPVTRPDNLQ
jgi:uncharacterized membrane protein